MKWTQTHIPTLREAPAEAEIISHQLLLRAGLVRKLAAGVYTFLPLGQRVLHKINKIIREEMDKSGCLEVFMPVLQPTELWEKTGRLFSQNVDFFRAYDRQKREWVLGPTHEEVITELVAAEVQSYKQLPKNFYQIQTKFRDEKRPRFGLLRTRELIMKDAYSFDVDDRSAEASYYNMCETYRRIFDRIGLPYKLVEADTGAMGGNFSHEFQVPATIGESDIVFTENGSYAAAIEKAVSRAVERRFGGELRPLGSFPTPGVKTIEALTLAPYNVAAIDQIKTLVYVADGKPILLLLRGDHQLNEAKLEAFLRAQREVRPASEAEIVALLGAHPGSLGAVGVDPQKISRVVADLVLQGQTNMVTGANKDDVHLKNVCLDRDIQVTDWVDLRTAQADELDVQSGQPLRIEKAIEVAHIFKLGTKYSQSLGANFLDIAGHSKPMIMGCYGIGVTRVLQTIIECFHDKDGICWPSAVAPYQIEMLELDPQVPAVREVATTLHALCQKRGWEVLWDDRDERPGVKFKDADLVGIPWRITIGAKSLTNGGVEIKARTASKFEMVPVEQVEKFLEKLFS